MEKFDLETDKEFVERVFETFSRKRRFAPHMAEILYEADGYEFMTWVAGIAAATKHIDGDFGPQRSNEKDENYVRRVMRALVQKGSGQPFVNTVEIILSDMDSFRGENPKIMSALRRAEKSRHESRI